ncbi:unnamed protein product, partial [Phaeothamnion confervicola]
AGGPGARASELAVVTVGAAALGAVTGWLIDADVAVFTGGAAAISGALAGWRGTYQWGEVRGWASFVLDHTWALVPGIGGLIAHGVAAASGSGGYIDELSHRQNRHVYRGGLRLKRGYALTIGNVISAAGNVERPSRRRLITDHEDVHIWQARTFGPLYPVAYVGWSITGALWGVVVWLRRRGSEPGPVSLGKAVETCSYYCNPFEWWAYSRGGNWPPGGKVPGLGWRKAAA